MILDRVNYPQDLKNLSIQELETLATEMRECIIKRVNAVGGHMGPNLGIVEATIAIHYVFNVPHDKLIFDVSHQSYPHKMLTGRKYGYTSPENYDKISGGSAPYETSEYDIFQIGHTSTGASLACGLAKSRDLKGGKENIIAVVGDGSLTGGEALCGFDNAAILGSNIILIVNDNGMSIAENFGGLYDNLKLLRETNGKAECNMFKAMGFDYYYENEGNNVEKMIKALEKVKDVDHPVVLHINTLKGKGLDVAIENKEMFHWVMPGILDKKPEEYLNMPDSYQTVTTDFLLNKAKTDKTVVAINAATPGALGLTKEFRNKMGKQYVDVGICEEHAVAFASGLAKGGSKPFLLMLSTFAQRTYDQISHDLCLNNSPATILIQWGGLSPAEATHIGSFDIPMLSNIPNLVYLAPTCKEEYLAMLEYAYSQNEHTLAIRIPNSSLKSTGKKDTTDYSKLNKFELVEKGEKIALVGLGNFFSLAQKIKAELKNKLNINATLINPKFITGLDEELLNNLKSNHEMIVTFEDGQLEGGFGEKISRFFGSSNLKVLNFGGKKEFTERMPLPEIYERNHLTKELIMNDIMSAL